ncbi:hypothetical protein ABH940_002847 [Streptacidiphilus sp. BW17]|uniref:DUF2637 domain-containing protein n=1 Tax=Streptacidiphilus sp. BW17 TaxID=3156274 RepID=UPI0035126851
MTWRIENVEEIGRGERLLFGTAAVLGVGVGSLGLASSFQSVTAAAARWGFSTPALLPIGIDTAIPVFTIINLLLIRLDMRLPWVRIVPWVLTLVTCWLNVAAGHSLSAKLAHGTMPLLWVVLSEVAAHIYAVRIGEATGKRIERIRRSRWFLAPFSSFLMWRRMTLWEITSYTAALALERERLLTVADLRETHGRLWRARAPRRTRVLLRMGQLAPADTLPALPDAEPAPVGGEDDGSVYLPEPTPRPVRKPRRTARKASPRRTEADVLDQARELTAQWRTEDITAEALRTALRCGAKSARAARDVLLAERDEDGRPDLHIA